MVFLCWQLCWPQLMRSQLKSLWSPLKHGACQQLAFLGWGCWMHAVVLVNAVGSSGKAGAFQRHFFVTYQPLHCFWAVLLYILLRSRNGGDTLSLSRWYDLGRWCGRKEAPLPSAHKMRCHWHWLTWDWKLSGFLPYIRITSGAIACGLASTCWESLQCDFTVAKPKCLQFAPLGLQGEIGWILSLDDLCIQLVSWLSCQAMSISWNVWNLVPWTCR